MSTSVSLGRIIEQLENTVPSTPEEWERIFRDLPPSLRSLYEDPDDTEVAPELRVAFAMGFASVAVNV